MSLRVLSKQAGSVPVDFSGDSFVSERFGFVYHCVPKALSRSMLDYLAGVDPDGYRIHEKHVGKEILTPGSGARQPTSFSFSRNPYSRIVAVYYDKFVNYRGTPGQQAMFSGRALLRPDMQFSEFVDWLVSEEGDDLHADPHFLSQHYFLLDTNGNPAVDYLGKVETATEDMAELQGLLGLKRQPLPRINSNATRQREAFDTSSRWQEILDDRSKRALASRYDGDFELLGYERLAFGVRPLSSRGSLTVPKQPAPLQRAGTMVKRILASLGFEVRRIRPRRRPSGGAR